MTQGVYYDANGRLMDPTSIRVFANVLVGAGSILGVVLCLATGVWGMVTTVSRNQYGWFALIIGAGVLPVVGIFAMALVILSENSPLPFVLPLAIVPLVTLLYSLRPEPAVVAVLSNAPSN